TIQNRRDTARRVPAQPIARGRRPKKIARDGRWGLVPGGFPLSLRYRGGRRAAKGGAVARRPSHGRAGGLELVAERAEELREDLRDPRLGEAELVGDLAERLVLEVVEPDDPLLALGEPRDERLDVLEERLPLERLEGLLGLGVGERLDGGDVAVRAVALVEREGEPLLGGGAEAVVLGQREAEAVGHLRRARLGAHLLLELVGGAEGLGHAAAAVPAQRVDGAEEVDEGAADAAVGERRERGAARGVVALQRLEHPEHPGVREVAVGRERVVRQAHAAGEGADEREGGHGHGPPELGRGVLGVALGGALEVRRQRGVDAGGGETRRRHHGRGEGEGGGPPGGGGCGGAGSEGRGGRGARGGRRAGAPPPRPPRRRRRRRSRGRGAGSAARRSRRRRRGGGSRWAWG